jgi:hypothetical protein
MYRPVSTARYFASTLFEDSSEVEPEVETAADAQDTSSTLKSVRILPIPKHPIFPKHMVKFRLGSESFKFLLQKDDTKHVAAFIMKKRETTEKDIEVFNL